MLVMSAFWPVNRGAGVRAMALDDGARGLGGDAEAFGDLSVAELFGRHD